MVTIEFWLTGPPLRSCSLYALKGRDKVLGMALISSLVRPAQRYDCGEKNLPPPPSLQVSDLKRIISVFLKSFIGGRL
jgi:hypothetical protein